jgi:hypothetical protein
MNVIQVKFDIDIDNEQQLDSFNVFVKSLKNSGGAPAIVQSPVKEIKLPATQATAPAATAPAQTATAPATTVPAANIGQDVSKKLFEIRKLIGEKAATHRQPMMDKLKELGAATATDLTVDKYEEFHQFLLTLV